MSYTRWHTAWFDLPSELTSVPAGFIQHVEDTFVSQDGRITTLESSGGGGGGAVTSVAGRTGVVTLAKADVGLNNVDNTSDVNKPVSTAQTTAINASAALAIPKTLVAAKGNLIVATASGIVTSLGVGADTQVLTADSTQASGTKWATPTGGGSGIPASTVTTKADLLAATASATVTRLGVGTDGQVLTAQSSQSTGLNWTTPTPAPVSSVAGRTGTIVLAHGDITGDAIILSDYGAKGSILTKTTSGTRASVAVGTDGQFLIANSVTAGGFSWATSPDIPQSIIGFQGDLIVGNASAVPSILSTTFVDGQVLTLNSSATHGMDWETPVVAVSTVQDEGFAITSRSIMNFIGPAIKAVDNSGNVRTDVTIAELASIAPDNSLSGWTFPTWACGSSQSLTTGLVYLAKIKIPFATSITKILWLLSTAAVGPVTAENEVGIYTSAGSKQASVNVDSSTTSSAQTLITSTISSITVSPPFIWVAFVFNASTTPATIGRSNSAFTAVFNAGLTAATFNFATSSASQTVLPSSITPSSNIAGPGLWAGIAA